MDGWQTWGSWIDELMLGRRPLSAPGYVGGWLTCEVKKAVILWGRYGIIVVSRFFFLFAFRRAKGKEEERQQVRRGRGGAGYGSVRWYESRRPMQDARRAIFDF